MFVATLHKSTVYKLMLLAAVIGMGGALLAWPQAVAGGISRGLSICYTVLIPSLFPFLVLAGFMTRSGIDAAVGRRMERVTRFLFGLPGRCAAGILIGFMGGYPAGGAAVGELLESGAITRRQARRMMLFCVNAGPAFVVSTVGAGMLGSARYGGVLLAAHMLASLIIGIAARFFDPPEKGSQKGGGISPHTEKAADIPLRPSAALAGSVNSACRSMLYMCGFVVLFAALQALGDVTGFVQGLTRLIAWPLEAAGGDGKDLDCLFPILTEVTGGCVAASTAGSLKPLLLGVALGWGGLSVHCQLTATLHTYNVMGRRFYLARLAHAALGGLLSVVLLRFIPIPAAASAPLNSGGLPLASSSLPAAVTLLAMCVLLLFTNSRTQSDEPNRKKAGKNDFSY